MSQLPTAPDEWYPLSPSQFLTAASSTAPTIPSIPGGQPGKGTVHVAIFTAVNGPMWIRFDGQAAFATIGAEEMFEGDWIVVYGYSAISAVRVVKDPSATGIMAIKYYYFRKTP